MRDPKIEKEILKIWPPRPKHAHKGDFGKIFILAGSTGYTGAAALTSFAALRAGAGLVTLGCPDKVYPILARQHPEVMVRPFPSTPQGTLSEKGYSQILQFLKTQDVGALGPGLGRHPSTQRLVRKLLLQTSLPWVVDADGINAFQNHAEILKQCKSEMILTPHPGEFVRVFKIKLPKTDEERKKAAQKAAVYSQKMIVLKGYKTVIASPDKKTAVNPTGNPGMATGGTGDVLTGIIAALLGQKMKTFDAARFGVYLHGLAGDIAAKKLGEVSLTAGDIIHFLPPAIQKVRG